MRDVLYLAWRYLAFHRIKTVILVASITLIVYLPVGLNLLVSQSSKQLTARAESTPLLIGAKGSPLELVLRSLYFESDIPADMQFQEVDRVNRSGLGVAVPLHSRYRTRHSPIVGTTLEYFEFRDLTLARGRRFGMLGECVLGAKAAEDAKVQPGDFVLSSPETLFDIAAVYPLKMKVVGVLQPTGTPDDRAVFVDVKTAWVIAGLGHGHDDLSLETSQAGVLRKDSHRIIANASVMQYNEITPENIDTFHFHGDEAEFPITAIIAVPHDEKSRALLRGRYLRDDDLVHIVPPLAIMDDLLQTIFTIRRYVLIAVAIIATASIASMILVFLLSFQLRRREMQTILKMGGSRSRIAFLVGAEVLSVVLMGIVLAGALSSATLWCVPAATRLFVQLS